MSWILSSIWWMLGWETPPSESHPIIPLPPVPVLANVPKYHANLENNTEISQYLVYTKPGKEDIASMVLNEISQEPCGVVGLLPLRPTP